EDQVAALLWPEYVTVGSDDLRVADGADSPVAAAAARGGIRLEDVEVQIDCDVLVHVDLPERLRQRAERELRVGLGVARDDDAAAPLEQRADANVVAGVAAVGQVDEAPVGVG